MSGGSRAATSSRPGQLRVTTVESSGSDLLPAIMAQFQAQTPGVVIDLSCPIGFSICPAATPTSPSGDQRSAGNAGRTSHLRCPVGDLFRRDLVAGSARAAQSTPFIGFAETSDLRRHGDGSRRISTRDGSPPGQFDSQHARTRDSTDPGRRSCPAISATPSPH